MDIKLINSSDLAELMHVFRNPSAQENEARYQKQQRGEAAYIVAEVGGNLVGKMYLKYTGANDTEVNSLIQDCPDMENLEVIESQRGNGIGTEIIKFAEQLAKDKGFKQIGLGVAVENEKARALYERLGYVQALEPFTISFPWKNADGAIVQLTEEVIYLTKKLI